MPLPVKVVLDKDVAVTLRDGVTIYVDLLRPVGAEKVPVMVAWSPYGKSRGNASQYVELYQMLGMDTGRLSGLHKFEGPDPAFGVPRDTLCATRTPVVRATPKSIFGGEAAERVRTTMTRSIRNA